MAFCTNCGTKLGENVKFCPNCGTRAAQPEPVAPISAPVVAEPAPTPVVVEPEPTPVVVEPEPVPVVAEPEPAPVVAEPEPVPVVAEPEPAPVVAEPEPAPVVAEPEPAPVVVEPEPAPVVVEPEPAPVVAEPEPAPVVAEPEPAPVVVEPEPAPVVVEPEPAPVVVEPEPAPVVVEPEPVPVVVEPEPTPVVVEPEPAPVVAEPAPAPAETKTYGAPVQTYSYTPPVQQQTYSYTPPAQQQTYTPPVQQSYSYTPPVQQEAPAAKPVKAPKAPKEPKAPKAPKEKKEFNLNLDKKKLIMFGGIALAVILVIVLIASLAGGGKNKGAADDPNLGLYNAVTAEAMGFEMPVTDVWAGGFSIELMEKGKFEMVIDGTKGKGKWELDGDDFHLKGGGIDCDGTLSGGILKLEDVLDMGVNLTFEKEGGFVPSEAPDKEPGGAAAEFPNLGGEAGGVSALQEQWNGTWYGVMYVSEATGDFSGIPSDFYDIYTIVDVDESGKGVLDVYLAGVEDAFASASCQAADYGIDTLEGTIAGGTEINPSNWMFRQSPDWPGKYVIMDTIEYDDSYFEYYIFIRQWGDSWQADVDTDFEMVPPSWAEYEEAIANGEEPPVGFAPVAFGGSGSGSSSSGAGASGSAGGASGVGFSGPTATFDYGQKGMIFFDYPASYNYEDKFGVESLKNADETLKISFVADWGLDDYAARMEGYSVLVDESDGVLEEGLSFAGFEATRVTWEDIFGDVNMETYILFGEGNGDYVGVNVTVYGTADVIASNSAEIEAILNSVRLK